MTTTTRTLIDPHVGERTTALPARLSDGRPCWQWDGTSLILEGEARSQHVRPGRPIRKPISIEATQIAPVEWTICAETPEHAALLREWAAGSGYEMV